MSGQLKITEYPNEALVFSGADEFDVSKEISPGVFDSQKYTYSTFLNSLQGDLAFVSGSGTANKLAKFTGSTIIGDSQLRDDGTTVDIGGSVFASTLLSVATSTLSQGFQGQSSRTGAFTTVGVFGRSSGASTIGVGVKGEALGATSKYGGWFIDGTEGVGKLLTSVTSDGKANWQTINDFTNKATPDTGADYVLIYDAAGTTHKKALLNSFAVNLSNTNLTQTANSRTYSLDGNTSASTLKHLTGAGGDILTLFGDKKIGFFTSTFSSIGGGETYNIAFGEASNPASIEMHFSTTPNRAYYGLTQFVGANTLHNLDPRGYLTWVSQTNGTNTDIQFTLAGNGARITTNGFSSGTWQSGYRHAWNGVTQLDVYTNNALHGQVDMGNSTGAIKIVLGTARSFESSWFAEGLVLGGSRGRSATAMFDNMGTGSTSATINALFQNASGGSILTLLDDKTASFSSHVQGVYAPNTTSIASSSTPTIDADTTAQHNITALAANATYAAPTGTPQDGQVLTGRVKDNGIARTLAFNAIFRAVGVTLPPTTVISKTLYWVAKYNLTDTKWDVIAVGQEA